MMNEESLKLFRDDKAVQKLKILMLHGYRQNAEVFKAKTGSFRKILHKLVEFTYITAPHKVLTAPDNFEEINSSGVEPDISQCKDAEQYGWFFNRDDKSFRGIRKGGPAIGFDESVKVVENVFEEEGPFDGILGFSQGACFLGLLCDLQQRGLLKFSFDFIILVSGFKSGSLPHLKYYNERIVLPSLQIFGTNDQIIPTEMSEALSNCFENPLIVRHEGGHYLPANSQQKHDYQRFIKTQLLVKRHNETLSEK